MWCGSAKLCSKHVAAAAGVWQGATGAGAGGRGAGLGEVVAHELMGGRAVPAGEWRALLNVHRAAEPEVGDLGQARRG